MAEGKTLHAAFIEELRDAYDAERQLTKALPKLAKAASSDELREAFESHLEETREHVTRLEEAFGMLDEKVRGKHCEGIAGIIEEGKSAMQEELDDETTDAVLIASAQRAEHYEIAAYGTLVAWAEVLGHTEVTDLLRQTLEEEKAADEKLTGLGEGGINQRAADAGSADMDEEEDDMPAAAPPARRSMGMASGTTRRGSNMGVAAERRTPSGGAMKKTTRRK